MTPPPPPRASRRTSFAWSLRPSSRAPRRPRPRRETDAPVPNDEALREEDGLRRLRDTERDADPDAPNEEAQEDDWDKLGAEDEVPTFFEAIRPHLRRNQRGPGFSVGVDYLAKKWDITEAEVIGALKECGLEVPDDEDAKVTYVDYDGDLYWVNINRRGELWINTKEKSRPVFRTVQATKVEAPEEAPGQPEAEKRQEKHHEERKQHPRRHEPEADPGGPAPALPEGPALLDRIRPLMRKNRREPGGSGSMSFLSRALKCSEAALVGAFTAMGLNAQSAAGDPPVFVEIGDETWWLNTDSRGGVWINAREKRGEAGAAQAPQGEAPQAGAAPEAAAPAPGNVFAAVRLLLKETKTGSVAAPVGRLGGRPRQVGRRAARRADLLGSPGSREAEGEAGVRGARGRNLLAQPERQGRLWLNAKASKYSAEGEGDPKGRRPRPKKKAEAEAEPLPAAPEVPDTPAGPEAPVPPAS